MSPYVLVIGYRKQLAIALNKLGIPYSVWSDKPLKSPPPGADQAIVAPFTKAIDALEQQLEELSLAWAPTHVIAGTESAVFPAASLRRVYHAKRSPETLLIRCTDKAAMKHYLTKYNIPMTAYVEHRSDLTAEEIVSQLGLPVVVKDRRNSGGRNIEIGKSLEEIRPLIKRGHLYEAFVDAPEGSIESFIQDGEIVFTSITEYYEKKISNIVPAGYQANELEEIKTLNLQVIKAMNINWGLTHLEYYRSPTGLLFGEIALRPPGGHIMELIAQSYGFDPWEIFVKIETQTKIAPLPESTSVVSGCVLIHPGAGVVDQITKPNPADYPTLLKCRINVKSGDQISKRQGVGEEAGHCLFKSDSYETITKDIDRLCQADVVTLAQPK